MRTIPVGYKTQIATLGRELDAKITYNIGNQEIILGQEELVSVSPVIDTELLKSVMKGLNIESNVEIPSQTQINCQIGVKINNQYKYINFGNYYVYESEKTEETNSYKITCYDKMLYSMKEYTELQNGTFPMTVRDYIGFICDDLELTFANSLETFTNYDRVITEDPYKDLHYTYRDILDELSQVTASNICMNNSDELEIRYINDTNETITEDYLKDINVNFGEKYGPINVISLTRSADSDTYHWPEELPEEVHEYNIKDNQIMNGLDRSQYAEAIYNRLNGLEFYVNDYKSTGIMYFEPCDMYSVQIGDTNYQCVMFSDEIILSDGLVENIYTEKPADTGTEFKYSTPDEKADRKTYLIVDKVNERIDAQAKEINLALTHVDKNGNVTEVTTTTGFTFNANGMTISDNKSDFKALHRNDGTYYKDGNDIVGQYTKDGSKQKDLSLFGVYYYGMEKIDDTAMFVGQLYHDDNGDEAFGHFYNGGDI